MDKTFQKFLRSKIDLSPVGVCRSDENTPYFCTPKGAAVFGWASVDGIHFCFIRGFGGTVFSVSPMNSAPDYVHPLAKDFKDFLRLLIACGDVAALEQAWMWNEAEFDNFLKENSPTEEQKEVLSNVAKFFDLSAMEHPWAYLKNLQSSFDYGKIKYTEDFYDDDLNPSAGFSNGEWKVYFGACFWGHSGKDRPGSEILIGKEFDWAKHHWVIPAAYACGKGLVVDFCMRSDAKDILAFEEKWGLSLESDSGKNFTPEEQMQMASENPLELDYKSRLQLNGKNLSVSRGCSLCYNPCLPNRTENTLEALSALEHYNLDKNYGWVITRNAYPWSGTRRPAIKGLSLAMAARPFYIPGPHFAARKAGDKITFPHPVNGTEYVLTVRELEEKTFSQNSFGDGVREYPTHALAMNYTLFPEDDNVFIVDCGSGDRPREAESTDKAKPVATNAAVVIGIIRGADGPVVVTLGDKRLREHSAFSSLYFEKINNGIEWRVKFKMRPFNDATFTLI